MQNIGGEILRWLSLGGSKTRYCDSRRIKLRNIRYDDGGYESFDN